MPYHLALIAAAVIAAPTVQGGQTQQSARQANPQTTKAQFTNTLDARFVAFDLNKDGRLDRAEVAAAQSSMIEQRAAARRARLETRFEQLDTNNDEQLSIAEFLALAAPVRPNRTADQMLGQVDSNQDGFVSIEEFRAGPLARFDRIDRNDDGVITAAERRQSRRGR